MGGLQRFLGLAKRTAHEKLLLKAEVLELQLERSFLVRALAGLESLPKGGF